MSAERFGHFKHLTNAGLAGFVALVFEENFHLLSRDLIPEFAQFVL
jgi:hypothetical protein